MAEQKSIKSGLKQDRNNHAVDVSRVPAVSKSWRIIGYIASSPDASISELSKALTISKSTVSDIVNSLCQASVLVRRANEPRFRLGPELIAMGGAAQRQMPERRVVRELLKSISKEWHCTVVLTQLVEQSLSFVIVESVQIPGPGAFVATVGAQLSFPSRAVGRAYLSALSRKDAERLVQRWRQHTEAEFDSEAFYRPIELARDRGYATNRSESSTDAIGDVNAVSVPILDRNRQVKYVLALMGYPRDLPTEKLADAGKALIGYGSRLASYVD